MADDRIETAEARTEAAHRYRCVAENQAGPTREAAWVRDAFVAGAAWQASRPDVHAAQHDREVASAALRDHRRRVERFMPPGLVNRAGVLADLDDYADRAARGTIRVSDWSTTNTKGSDRG